MSRIRTSSKAAVKKRRKEINISLRKAGITSLQEVLNTSILSDDAKIKHIRHTYTCYDKYLKTFYRDGNGIELRKELNNFILGLVKGEYTIEDLKTFNKNLKIKLEATNDNYTQEQKALLTSTDNVIETPPKCEYVKYKLENLTEKEQKIFDQIPDTYFNNKMTEEHKNQIAWKYIESRRNSWRNVYKSTQLQTKITKYIVQLYLENRNPKFYPKDFSDLDFLAWKDIVSLAKDWLLCKFENDIDKYTDFINITLPNWIEVNNYTLEDKLKEIL